MTIYGKLLQVQSELKAPKGQYNAFGKYNYRNCEDILEAAKPLLKKNGLTLLIEDSVEIVQERYYIKAECRLVDIETGEIITTSALARESLEKKGMDASQVTGATSSYARKYALNGLFLIDDTKDADHYDNSETKQDKKLSDSQVKRLYAIAYNNGFTSEQVKLSLRDYKKTDAKELTKQEYDHLVSRLENAKTKQEQMKL